MLEIKFYLKKLNNNGEIIEKAIVSDVKKSLDSKSPDNRG